MRRNVIVSHGGKHGVGGTYLAGQPLPPDAAAHVPAELQEVARPVPAASRTAATPAVEDAAKSETRVLAGSSAMLAGAPPAAPPARALEIPSNRRELNRLSPLELSQLVAQLGIAEAQGPDELHEIRNIVAKHLGLK